MGIHPQEVTTMQKQRLQFRSWLPTLRRSVSTLLLLAVALLPKLALAADDPSTFLYAEQIRL